MFNFLKSKKKPKIRKFEAAETNRYLNNWIATTESSDKAIENGKLSTIRNKARELVQNNEFARRYIQLLINNVLGENGIGLEMNVRDDNGQADEQANNLIERHWKKFSKAPTTDGALSMIDLQSQALSSTARDGEIFYQKVLNYGPNNFALFPIEADHLKDDHNLDRPGKGGIRLSVEKDKWGKVTAYHISENHPGDDAYGRIKIVPSKEIIHVYKNDRARDTRGVSWFAPSIITLKHLKEYFKSELVASRIASGKAGFFVRSNNEGEGFSGDRENENGQMIMDIQPGSFSTLPQGVSLQTYDPQNPHSNFDNFTKTLLRKCAAGLGVSYNSLTVDLESVNYSSMRAGTLEEREFYKVVQKWMIEHFLQPVFESWLMHKLQRGDFEFQNGNRLPVAKFEKFNSPRWVTRRWPWVDPSKDIKAAIDAIDNNLRSRGEIIAETYGGNHKDLMQKIYEEKELENELGISGSDDATLTQVNIEDEE